MILQLIATHQSTPTISCDEKVVTSSEFSLIFRADYLGQFEIVSNWKSLQKNPMNSSNVKRRVLTEKFAYNE